MWNPSSRPSLTSLIALVMIAAPVYVLSYAPVVRVCRRTAESPLVLDPDIPWPQGSTFPPANYEYPPYRPVDWLIDRTPLKDPLLDWAELWGVRREFEWASIYRGDDHAELRPYEIVRDPAT